jgi:hypothetical protein
MIHDMLSENAYEECDELSLEKELEREGVPPFERVYCPQLPDITPLFDENFDAMRGIVNEMADGLKLTNEEKDLVFNEEMVQDLVNRMNSVFSASSAVASNLDRWIHDFNLANDHLKLLHSSDYEEENSEEDIGLSMTMMQDLLEQLSGSRGKELTSRIALTAEEIELTMDIKLLEMQFIKAKQEEKEVEKRFNVIVERNKEWEREVYELLEIPIKS